MTSLITIHIKIFFIFDIHFSLLHKLFDTFDKNLVLSNRNMMFYGTIVEESDGS